MAAAIQRLRLLSSADRVAALASFNVGSSSAAPQRMQAAPDRRELRLECSWIGAC